MKNSAGFALVLVLIVTALITAMVAEFVQGVYTTTNSLYNWQASQRLSLLAQSGVDLSSNLIFNYLNRYSYTYPGVKVVPLEKPFEDFEGEMYLRIEDENSRFNINTLVYTNGLLNDYAYGSFKRLLSSISLDSAIADRIVDWIDPDREPRLPDSEVISKNAPLDSTDELLLIPGIDKAIYDKLLPHVTIYGDGRVNINGAEIPALMSLSDSMDSNMAERIVKYREVTPFENSSQIQKVAGFEGPPGQSLMGRITVKGSAFRVVSTVMFGGVKTIVECIIDTKEKKIIYWKES